MYTITYIEELANIESYYYKNGNNDRHKLINKIQNRDFIYHKKLSDLENIYSWK